MLRSILSVIAGYLAWTAVWLGGGAAAFAVFGADPDDQWYHDDAGLLGVFLALSIVCSGLAGVVCAKIARTRSLVPASVLAGLLLLTGLGVQIGSWERMPVWYHIPFLLLLAPVTICAAGLARPKALP